MEKRKQYTIRYYWDEQYHECIVETSSGRTTARKLALDVAKTRHHYPYGELKILREESIDDGSE